MRSTQIRSWTPALLVLGVLVLAWRVAAWMSPYAGDAGRPGSPTRLALAILGLLYLVCGVAAYLRHAGRSTRLFAFYGLASGLHWGGPIGAGRAAVEEALLLLYLTASSFLGQAFFAHLALVFAEPWQLEARRWIRATIYLPAALAATLSILVLATGGVALSPASAAYGALLVLPTLLSLFGVAVFVVRFVGATTGERASLGLVPVLGALVLAVAASSLSGLGLAPPQAPHALNLGYAPLPVAFLWALGKPAHRTP